MELCRQEVRPGGAKFLYLPQTSHGAMLLNLMCLEWLAAPTDETEPLTVRTLSGDQFTISGDHAVRLWARLISPLPHSEGERHGPTV